MSENDMLPCDVAAEQSLLGALLISRAEPAALMESAGTCAEHFYRLAHQDIWRAIVSAAEQGYVPEPETVRGEMVKAGTWPKSGGVAYLMELGEVACLGPNAIYLADELAEVARRRALVVHCKEALQKAADGVPVDDLLAGMTAEIARVTEQRPAPLIPMPALLAQAEAQMQARSAGGADAIWTGLRPLDSMLRGIEGGQLVIVAGRPGSGKSAFACNVALENAVTHGKPCVFYTAEVPAPLLTRNLMRMLARVDYGSLARGTFTGEVYARWKAASEVLARAPLWIVDVAGKTSADIASHARRMRHERGVALVILDYVQLVRERSGASRNQEVSDVVQTFKRFTLTEGIVTVLVSQLGRPQEGVSRMEWSGELEQAPDVILRIQYQAAYDDPDAEEPEIAPRRILLAKHKTGRTGRAEVLFDKPLLTFREDAGHERFRVYAQTDAGRNGEAGRRDGDEGTAQTGIVPARDNPAAGRGDLRDDAGTGGTEEEFPF